MTIGLFRFSGNKKPCMEKTFLQLLELNRYDYLFLDPSKALFWESAKICDVIIMHFGQYRSQMEQASIFLPMFEYYLGKKCFPSMSTSWHYDDKIKQYYLLSWAGFNYVPCHIFFDSDSAYNFAASSDYPLVFKLRGGAGSSNVRLVNSKQEANRFIKIMFTKGIVNSVISLGVIYDARYHGLRNYTRKKLANWYHQLRDGFVKTDFWGVERDYILFQDFYPDNKFDTRVTIIGNRAFAFRRFNRPHDFRASGSGLIDWDKDRINLNCVTEAFRVSDHFCFQSMAYDFIFDSEGKPAICEISYTYQDKAVFKCDGYWDRELQWHMGHYWPQYCILSDLTGKDLTNIK